MYKGSSLISGRYVLILIISLVFNLPKYTVGENSPLKYRNIMVVDDWHCISRIMMRMYSKYINYFVFMEYYYIVIWWYKKFLLGGNIEKKYFSVSLRLFFKFFRFVSISIHYFIFSFQIYICQFLNLIKKLIYLEFPILSFCS